MNVGWGREADGRNYIYDQNLIYKAIGTVKEVLSEDHKSFCLVLELYVVN
jgi:hypothetical protein